jgi:alkaline phosphatase D
MEAMNHGKHRFSRRALLRGAAAGWAGALAGTAARPLLAAAPAVIVPAGGRPALPYGVQSGDVGPDRAVIWSCCDRPARMIVEHALNDSFRDAQRLVGPAALEATDFTARLELTGLPAGQRVFYRVIFQDLRDPTVTSEPVSGTLRVPATTRRDLLFAWSADTVGQGWGINLDWGGMKTYEAIRQLDPDFFIHSGDSIYADGPVQAEVTLDGGQLWKNLVTPEKAKVAETLDEFRGNYRYNLLDANLRRFNAQVPQLVQWDDHETRNNWYPGQRLVGDARYTTPGVDLLAARGRRAFLDYTPVRFNPRDPERIYRSFPHGPSLEVFMLDARSYRGPNGPNRQPMPGEGTQFLGSAQTRWLKQRLRASTATWKVIASDMPVGLVVRDGATAFESWANGDGPPLGRELELAGLLRSIKQRGIRNVVWVTADVHYAAAHYYDPGKAQFTDFSPFWEFVAGPLNAGTFGPAPLDNTFGPQVKFTGIPPGMKPNRPPSDGFQFFGTVRIDGQTEVMTVTLRDLTGRALFSVDLAPEKPAA